MVLGEYLSPCLTLDRGHCIASDRAGAARVLVARHRKRPLCADIVSGVAPTVFQAQCPGTDSGIDHKGGRGVSRPPVRPNIPGHLVERCCEVCLTLSVIIPFRNSVVNMARAKRTYCRSSVMLVTLNEERAKTFSDAIAYP